jgi:hypothetical protein
MAKSGYTITTEGEVALAAAGTVKTVLGVDSGTDLCPDILSWWVDLNSITAGDHTVKISLLVCTFATNGPGTNSTSVTVKQAYGRVAGTGFTAAKNWTAEPTTVESQSYDEFSLDANKGLWRYDSPLGQTYDCALGSGFIIRALIETGDTVTAASIRAGMKFERG